MQKITWFCGAIVALLSLVQMPAMAAPSWQLNRFNNSQFPGYGTESALKLDSSGNPVVVFYDFNNPGALRLGHCTTSVCSGTPSGTPVSLGTAPDGSALPPGLFPSLALDSLGNPVISYYDYLNHLVKLAHCVDANCSGAPAITTLDSNVTVVKFTSLKLDNNGNPVVSYDNAYGGLRLARCSDTNCSNPASVFTLDSTASVGGVGSLALDATGAAVVSYSHSGTNNLMLARCADVGCSTPRVTIVAGASGLSATSLKLDASGYPVISFQDQTGAPTLVHCNDAFCNSPVSKQGIDGSGGQSYSAVALNGSGNPIISYLYSAGGNPMLKVAFCSDADCANKTTSIVDSNLSDANPVSMVLDNMGYPTIAYYTYYGAMQIARFVDAPTAAPAATPAANANGWNNTDVSVNWNWTETGGPGIDPAKCTTSSVSTGEGTFTLTATCTDTNGIQGNAVYIVNVDKTPPTCTVSASVNAAQPKDEKQVVITANVSVSPGGSATSYKILSVTSTNKDGERRNDVLSWTQTASGLIIKLGHDRKDDTIYSLTYEAADLAGNTGNCSTTARKTKK